MFAGDVAKADVAEAMADFTVRTYGLLDILHNNVGIGGRGAPETVSLDVWNSVLEASLTTTMLCTKYCLPRMREGGGGSTAGTLGLTGGVSIYSTAKAGLHGFKRSVAADYAAQNIRANCIIIGSVNTPMVGQLMQTSSGAEKECRCKHPERLGTWPMARSISLPMNRAGLPASCCQSMAV